MKKESKIRKLNCLNYRQLKRIAVYFTFIHERKKKKEKSETKKQKVNPQDIKDQES